MATPNATIVKRPLGFVMSTSPVSATALNDGYNYVVINSPSHGLTTGIYIYIKSYLSSYNGFWYVSVVDANNFYLKEYAAATNQIFINSGNISYYVNTSTHNVNCIHLPIVYKFSNQLFPTNTLSTGSSILSFTNLSTYTQLSTASGITGLTMALQFVKITGAASLNCNGIFQVLTFTNSSTFSVNIPYNASNSFSGAFINTVYNNYKINVNVWAGLNPSSPAVVKNAYQKICTVSVVPDMNNICSVNINEFLKSDLNILENNLINDYLPLNTDSYDNFYIEYFETYDQSNGTSVSTYTSSTVSDFSTFEGMATNSKLPFKSMYQSMMSDYLINGAGKFLTYFSAPVMFACSTSSVTCQYQDVSFINNYSKNITALVLVNNYYKNNVLQSTINQSVNIVGNGLYRVALLNPPANVDRCDIYLQGTFSAFSPTVISSFNTKNVPSQTPSGIFLNSGYYPIQYSASSSGAKMVYFDCEIPAGSYYLSYSYNCPVAGASMSIQPIFLDDDFNYAISGATVNVTPTFGGGSLVLNTNQRVRYLGFVCKFISGSSSSFSFNYRLYNQSMSGDPVETMTQTVSYKINTGCSNQTIFLSWLNPLGGFDYWAFTGRATTSKEIDSVITFRKNIYNNWPNSYGEFANTINSESKRLSHNKYLVRSQNVDISQIDSIAAIKQSPAVFIVNTYTDVRRVLVDNSSFDVRKDGDKTFNISFNIVYTDEFAAQEL